MQIAWFLQGALATKQAALEVGVRVCVWVRSNIRELSLSYLHWDAWFHLVLGVSEVLVWEPRLLPKLGILVVQDREREG